MTSFDYELITSGPNQVPKSPHPEVPNLRELGPQETNRGGYFALNLKVKFDDGDNIDDYKHVRAAFILNSGGGEMRNGDIENPSKKQMATNGQSRIVFDEPGVPAPSGGNRADIGSGAVSMALIAGEYNKKTKTTSSTLAYYKLTLVFQNGKIDKTHSTAMMITRDEFINLTKKQLSKNKDKQLCPECALQP